MEPTDLETESEAPVPERKSDPKKTTGGLSTIELDGFLDDMKEAPAWRTRADLEADYYDGNQHSPDAAKLAAERKLPLITVNLVAPTINMVLGMEARARTDWVVKPAHDSMTSRQASALSEKLNEAERATHADRACSEAHAGQVKTGMHWVEVSRNSNPFEYPYRVLDVHRREIWWDMRARDLLLRDARWLVRRKWHDFDHLEAMLPDKYHRLIGAMRSMESSWDLGRVIQQFPMLQDELIARDLSVNNIDEYLSSDRRRALAYEVWYRRYVRGIVLKFPDGRAVEYDKANPIHNASVVAGHAQVVSAVYPKMRLSWWLGPFRLYDFPTPLPHQDFPYTPFWGFREDLSGTPYGMIRAMKSLQDEVNARRAKMMWQLSAVRVIVEEDAVDDHAALANEIARPDAYIKLKKNRRNIKGDGIQIQEHQGLSTQQFSVYQDAARSLQQAVGVFSPMLGDSGSGAEAGVAIDMLIQQGLTTLTEINDNYRTARTAVGTQLLSLVIADMAGKETQVSVPARGGRKASVTLNKPTQTEQGISYLENDVTRMSWRVALMDVPNTPSHRQQRMKDLVEYAKSLPDEMKVVFADIVVMASDLPEKEIIADRIRKMTGVDQPIDPNNASPEEMQELQAEQQQKDEQRARAEEERAITLASERAKTEKALADAEMARAKMANLRIQSIAAVVDMGKGTPATPGKDGAPGDPGEEPASLEEMVAAAEIAESAEDPVDRPLQSARLEFGPGMQP